MFKTLKEWFWMGKQPTVEQEKLHSQLLDCIKQIEAGKVSIEGKRAEAAFIWYVINFINTLNDEIGDSNRWYLQRHLNLFFMVFRRLNTLTYREILDLFPVKVPYEEGEKYFAVNDIPRSGNDVDSACEFRSGLGVLTLGGCGIYLWDQDEIVKKTDFDAEIGDNTMEFVANNRHPVLNSFYSRFLYVVDSLCDSIKMHR